MREDKDVVSAEDIELIKRRLQQLDDPIKLPYALRPENLRERITKEDRRRFREAAHGDFRNWQSLAATAAAVVLVVTAYVGLSSDGLNFSAKSKNEMFAAPSTAEIYDLAQERFVDDALPQTQLYAQDYQQIYTELNQILERTSTQGKEMLTPPPVSQTVPEAGGMGGMGGGEMSIATNDALDTPVEATNGDWAEVEAADVAKTDGTYLYYYRPANYRSPQSSVYIIKADDMSLVSRIQLEGNDGVEMYVGDGKLTLLVRQLESDITKALYGSSVQLSLSQVELGRSQLPDTVATPNGVTTVLVYDVSQPDTPTLERQFEQDGTYAVSSFSGSTLYLTTIKHLKKEMVSVSDPLLYEVVPVVRDSEIGHSQAILASDIVVAPSTTSPSYTVVSAIDVGLAQTPVVTKAVLGGGSDIYMSSRNLYIYYDSYAQDARTVSTSLVRMALRDGEIEVRAQGQVEGSLRSTLSLDEKDGLLRVATASVDADTGMTRNNLYVMDSKLELVGSMEGFAPGAEIESARYVGNMVYIVTQNQPGPIFAVDLSDPKNPQIVGQMELTSLSQNLVPVDEATFMGLDKNTRQTDTGELVASGLKLSLYDLSSPNAPKESGVLSLPGAESYSEALEDAKAFLYVPQQRLIGLPLLSRESGVNGAQARLLSWGYVLLTVDPAAGFSLLGTVTHADRMDDSYIINNFQNIERGLCIGDMLYTFSNSKVMATPLDDLKQSVTLVLE